MGKKKLIKNKNVNMFPPKFITRPENFLNLSSKLFPPIFQNLSKPSNLLKPLMISSEIWWWAKFVKNVSCRHFRSRQRWTSHKGRTARTTKEPQMKFVVNEPQPCRWCWDELQ